MAATDLANRYALSLYNVLRKKQQLERGSNQITWLMQLLAPSFIARLDTPLLSRKEKRKLLEKVFYKRLTPVLYTFLCLLIEKKRLGLLPPILETFQDRFSERGLKVYVKMAHKPTEPEKEKIQQFVKNFTQVKEIDLVITILPNLLGGCLLQFQGLEIDLTLRRRFQLLARKLAEPIK